MLKTSYISFCNKQTLNIIDDDFKEQVLENLSKNIILLSKIGLSMLSKKK